MHSDIQYIVVQYQTLRHRKMSEIWRKLLRDRNRCVLCSVDSCVFFPSVSVGSSAAESMSTVFHLGRMENDVNLYFLYINSVLSYQLLYLSLIESRRVRLQQNVFRSENIETVVFRCGADSAQNRSIQSIDCITQCTCKYCRLSTESYRSLLVSYCVFSPLSVSENLAPTDSLLSCHFCTIGIDVG